MGQKIKFILVGLIGVALIFVFLYLQTLNSKQLVIKERDNLKNENASLTIRVEKINKDLRQAQDKISSLKMELDGIAKERDDLEKKYEAANRSKELLEKMQSQAAQAQSTSTQAQGASQRSDDYWAAILTQKTELQMQLDSVRNELKTARVQNEELLRDKSTLELDITGLKRQAEELQHQIEYNKRIMDSIAQELVWEKNERIKSEEKIAPFKKENAMLARQLKGLNKQKMDLERRLQQLQEDKSGLAEKAREMETMLIDKISQINNLKDELESIYRQAQQKGLSQPKAMPSESKESVQLPPIVVRPSTLTMPSQEKALAGAPKPKGTILTVNRDSNFAIIDLGEDAGVKVDALFEVERGGETVAIIKVIKTSKSVSACDIKEEKAPVKVGDVVR
ncbi:MAG: hypothetical protein QME65_00360 [Candidatus Omnitrophota bacterium]|nr:hypothetical protein [Candidatus Omnitrophota bacterium]